MRTTYTISLLLKRSLILFKSTALTAFCCSLGAASAQTSVLLPVAHDVSLGYHDNLNTANTNYNSSIHFSAFAQPGNSGGVNKGRGLMDFDLSVIPAGATELGAFINLTAIGPFGLGEVASVGHVGPNPSRFKRVTEPWSDATVTWNTQPATTPMNAVPLALSTYPLQNYTSVDVTALVQDMIADPANSYGFMLELDDETPDQGLAFHSGLAPYPDQRPTLLVVYGECGVGMAEQTDDRQAMLVSPSIGAPGQPMVLNMPDATEQPSRLEVLDAAGRLVWSGPVRQWPAAWTVPALGPGAYTLTARDRDGFALGTARVIVR